MKNQEQIISDYMEVLRIPSSFTDEYVLTCVCRTGISISFFKKISKPKI